MPDSYVVTLDGPAGSGKTVCGRLAALQLGISFISSGLYYRALTFKAKESGIFFSDVKSLLQLAKELNISFQNTKKYLKIFLEGEEKTVELREPDITYNVKYIAENPQIRDILSEKMRDLARHKSLFAEGRDMGSVVFNDAAFKIFLEADIGCRVRRRYLEFEGMGKAVKEEELKKQIEERDKRDRNRSICPLVIPADAFVLDTSSLTIEEVVNRIVEAVRKNVFI